jgi:hypothetical protein
MDRKGVSLTENQKTRKRDKREKQKEKNKEGFQALFVFLLETECISPV